MIKLLKSGIYLQHLFYLLYQACTCELVLSQPVAEVAALPPAGLCAVFPCQKLNTGGSGGGRPVFPRACTPIIALHLMLKAHLDTHSPWLLS